MKIRVVIYLVGKCKLANWTHQMQDFTVDLFLLVYKHCEAIHKAGRNFL